MSAPTPNQLRPYIEQGLISAKTTPVDTPSGPRTLTVYNYTARCQYSGAWDDTTRAARGLIFDDAGRLVAHPWPKFFNLGEPDCPAPPFEPPTTITEKLDGSLGIGFVYDGEVRWSTRGTIGSPQAGTAQRIWQERHRHIAPRTFDGLTLLVEIIGPETRVIVPYETEALVLLGVVETATGEDWVRQRVQAFGSRVGLPVVADLAGELRSVTESTDRVRAMTEEEEGFVLCWERPSVQSPVRIKVKSPAYRRVARILTHTNPRRIADQWYARVPLSRFLPAPTRGEAQAIWDELDRDADTARREANALARRFGSPRALAMTAREHPLFLLAVRRVKGEAVDARRWVYYRRFGGYPRPVG